VCIVGSGKLADEASSRTAERGERRLKSAV